ncbi:MAG: diacylglycerol kinase family protein [Balneolaceae bacterium]
MSDNPTYCFLINCASNDSRAKNLFKKHESEIQKYFPGAEYIFIQKEDSIAQIARQKVKLYSHIIACGGDGTVNQVANGIIGSSAIMGVLPLGSGNDFAKSIGLGNNFKVNLDILLTGDITHIDAIKNEWGYFLNTFGIGVDGMTNYYATRSPIHHGSFRYFWGGLKALIQSDPFTVTISISGDTVPVKYRAWMVAVANGKNEGGKYTISPNSVNYDGKMEVVVVKDIHRIRLIIEFLKLSIGLPFHSEIMDVFVIKNSCTIQTDKLLKSHADGEQVERRKINNYKMIKGALPVITNISVFRESAS